MTTQHITPRQPEKIIYQGDDADRLAELTRQLNVAEAVAAQKNGSARFGDTLPSVDEAREALEAFVTEAADRAFAIKIQHIGRKRFRDLVLAHPPRQVDGEPDDDGVVKKVDHPDDWGFGVNMETAPMALLLFRDEAARTIVEPDLDEAGLRRLLDVELSDGDFMDVFGLAWALNTGQSADPKSAEGWLATRPSPATSEPDSDSD